MANLIQSTYAVTETTFGGTTAPAGAYGNQGITLDRILVSAVSSVAPNTSGGVELRYGVSSGATVSSMVILPSPTSVGLVADLTDLGIVCQWFQFESNEAGQFAVWAWVK